MQEPLITLETGELAKEKGFNNKCKSGWYPTNHGYFPVNFSFESDLSVYPHYILQPTQSLLQHWLREEHNCYVEVFFHSPDNNIPITKDNLKYAVEVNYYGADFDIPLTEEADFFLYDIESHEEALEIGLKEGLKLIKK